MRSGHDRTRNRDLETLLPVNDLVFQDSTVVADHITRNASVVIFVADIPAAAVIEHLLAEQALVVPIPEALSIYYLPTVGLLIGEAAGRDGRGRPSSSIRWWPERPEGLAAQSPSPARLCTSRTKAARIGRSYFLCTRGGVPVKKRIIVYTTRQREEVG